MLCNDLPMIFRCFDNFRRFKKFIVQLEKLFYVDKNGMKLTFRGKFIGSGGQMNIK